MLEKLLTSSEPFFTAFEEHAARTLEGARLLCELLQSCSEVEETARRIKDLEGAGDTITHKTIELLHTTFVTPLDRTQIHRLITGLDDVLDLLEGVAEQVWLYEIREPTAPGVALARLLVQAVEAIGRSLPNFRDLRDPKRLEEEVIEVHRIENEADELLRSAVAGLFATSTDPMHVLKWKDVYEQLEEATDACEEVAGVIEAILLQP